jgi:ribosomal protein S12 methylthiotransferase
MADLKYAAREWRGTKYRTRMTQLCEGLAELGVWVRLHYVYPYPHVDEVIPLMADGRLLPYLDIPFQHASARILKLMKRPAASAKTLERVRAWREGFARHHDSQHVHRRFPGETECRVRGIAGVPGRAQLSTGRWRVRLLAG